MATLDVWIVDTEPEIWMYTRLLFINRLYDPGKDRWSLGGYSLRKLAREFPHKIPSAPRKAREFSQNPPNRQNDNPLSTPGAAKYTRIVPKKITARSQSQHYSLRTNDVVVPMIWSACFRTGPKDTICLDWAMSRMIIANRWLFLNNWRGGVIFAGQMAKTTI